MDINLLAQTVQKSMYCKAIANAQTQETELDDLEFATPETEINLTVPQIQASIKDLAVTDIKAAIYNYCHPQNVEFTATYGKNFDSICSKLGIGPNQTIKKSDLTKLSNNDTYEDPNNDLYGAFNRAFAFLGANDEISYNDLMLFFMRGANNDGTLDFSEYKNVVNKYANEVEKQYQACSTAQAKLNFVIEKTEQYLTESNMTLQLAALNRLKSAESDNNTTKGGQIAHVGQISFGDLGPRESDGSYTKGGYQPSLILSGSSVPTTNTYNGKTYDVDHWVADFDNDWTGEWIDGGITLNSTVLLNDTVETHPWYEIVETLVHELTHATAYYYYDVGLNKTTQEFTKYQYSDNGMQFMIDKGIISAGAYDKTDYTDAELAHLVNTMWGEYAAYITSCNYMDSIAGDIFDAATNDLCKSGTSAEKSAIYNHIEVCGYNTPNNEPEPFVGKWDIYNTMFYA